MTYHSVHQEQHVHAWILPHLIWYDEGSVTLILDGHALSVSHFGGSPTSRGRYSEFKTNCWYKTCQDLPFVTQKQDNLIIREILLDDKLLCRLMFSIFGKCKQVSVFLIDMSEDVCFLKVTLI